MGSSKGCGPFREFSVSYTFNLIFLNQYGYGNKKTYLFFKPANKILIIFQCKYNDPKSDGLGVRRSWEDDCSAYDYIEHLIYGGEDSNNGIDGTARKVCFIINIQLQSNICLV